MPPPQWSSGELAGSTPGANWWNYFQDERLAQAIQTALENSHDLQAAAARIEAARAESVIAKAPELPAIDASFNRSQQRQNFIGFPIPGREDTVLSTTSTNLRLRLGASWEPDLWGRIRAGSMASFRNVQVRQTELASLRLSLSGQVAMAWFSAIEASRQAALGRATLDNFKTSATRIGARFEAGVRSSLDLRLALAEVSRAEASLEVRNEQLARAVRQMETLMGVYPSGQTTVGDELPDPAPMMPGELPSELVHRRPDLFAAELRALAADLQLTQARADLRPSFSLTSAAGTASDKLKDLVNGDLFIWSLVGNLVQPIFNNGRLRAAVDRNEALAREAFANYESVILRAYGEVESALAAEAILERRQQASAEAVLRLAEVNLERTVIRAPFAGRVRQEQVEIGQFISRGAPIARIYAIDYAEIELPIQDSELAYLDLPYRFRDDDSASPFSGPRAILRAQFGGRTYAWEETIVRTTGE